MSWMIKALVYLWQLPQNLLGLLLVWLYGARPKFRHVQGLRRTFRVWVSDRFPSGISLGRYIILKQVRDIDIAHEYGHQRQSLILGWFYLPLVGLWSGIRCGLHLYKDGHYYDTYPEYWADRLGGIVRKWDGKRQFAR